MTEALQKHKFIVFCEDHYNPLGMLRSLGEEGILPIVVLIADDPVLVNNSKYIKTLHQVHTKEEGIELIINKYGNETEKPFIFTGSDSTTECLDAYYDELIDRFYFFNCGGKGNISKYMEKETICNVSQQCGIPIPKGEMLKRGELPKGLRYPILTKVTKSTKGAWKDDVHICANEDELKEAWPQIKADEMLVQEFITKKNELCVDGISINGGDEVWFPYTSEYIRFTKEGYGNYMWIKPYKNEEVRKKIHNIIKATGFTGIFSLECLIDENDDLYFLEVNFRNSTWSYAYTYAGLNLPYQWAKSTIEGHIDYSSATLMDKPFLAMSEFNDLGDIRKSKAVSLFTWFKQARNCDVLYYYNKNDKKPFYAYLKRKLLHFLKLR